MGPVEKIQAQNNIDMGIRKKTFNFQKFTKTFL
jgi:hypothetical protein